MIVLPQIKKEMGLLFSNMPKKKSESLFSNMLIHSNEKREVKLAVTDSVVLTALIVNNMAASRDPIAGCIIPLKRRMVIGGDRFTVVEDKDGSMYARWNNVPIRVQKRDTVCNPRKIRSRVYPLGKVLDDIKRAIKFIDAKKLNKALTGIHLKERHGQLLVEATDGHTLYRNLRNVGWLKPCWSIIIPKKTAEQIVRLDKLALSLEYRVSTNRLELIVTGKMKNKDIVSGEIYSKLIDELYPDTDSVMVGVTKVKCEGNTQEMLDKLQYIRNTVPLDKESNLIEFIGSEVKVKNPNSALPDYKDKSPVTLPVRVGYNVGFLLKIFATISSKQFVWYFENVFNSYPEYKKPYMAAAEIHAVDSDGAITDETYLAMPVRID